MGGNVNHKSLFDSMIHNHFDWIKIGICDYPSSFLPFSSDPYFLYENSIFLVYKSTATKKWPL